MELKYFELTTGKRNRRRKRRVKCWLRKNKE